MKNILVILFLIPFFLNGQNTELLIQKGHEKKINVIKFSPDGTFFATGGDDNLIVLIETSTGILFKTLRQHNKRVEGIYFSPDGKKMFSCDESKTYLWDLEKYTVIRTFKFPFQSNSNISVSPDSKEFMFEDDRYDLATGENLPELSDKMREVNIYSPDGKYILFLRDDIVYVWDRNANAEKFSFGTQQKPHCCYITKDSKYYYCANEYGNWQQWNILNGKLEGTREGKKDNRNSIGEDFFSLVNDQHTLFAIQDYEFISIYDLWTGRLLQKIEYGNRKSGNELTAACFSPEGNVLVCANIKKGRYNDQHKVSVKYFDTKSGRTIRETNGFQSAIKAIDISPDEKHLSIMGEQPVHVWEMDRAGGRMISLGTETDKMQNTYWSPDSKVLYANNKGDGSHSNSMSFMVDLNTMNHQTNDEHFSYLLSKGTNHVSDDFKLSVGFGRIVEFETGKPLCEINLEKDYATKDFGFDEGQIGFMYGSMYISSDNKSLIIVNGVEKSFINVYDISACKKTAAINYESGHDERYGTETPIFSIKSGKIIAIGVGKIGVFDLESQQKILEIPAHSKDTEYDYTTDFVTAMELNDKENILAVAYRDTTVILYEIPSGKILKTLKGHDLPVTSIKFRINPEMLLTAGPDGQIKFWNIADGKELGTLVPVDSTDFIIKTPQNYYYATKNALRNMAFRIGKKNFPFEQFDLKYNRPDIVFKQIEMASEKQIKTYNLAYKKRLQKAGFTEEMLDKDFHLPVAEVKNKFEIPILTEENKLTFTVNLNDTKYKLKRLNVYVNDVSIYGSKGFLLPDEVASFSKDVTVNLSAGINRIQVSTTNQKGVESMRELFEISCNKETNKPDLYMLVVGVSEYSQSTNNLKYAAKDAMDLAKAFKENEKFGNIFLKEITNAQATKENILNEAAMFSKSKEEDVAIIYISGHGLLDEKMDYYLATTDVDFVNPSEKGLPYQELENVIDNIPARNRLIMIDACHSGEVDKEEVQLATNQQISSNENVKVVFKGSRAVVPKAGLNNSFAYMQVLFDDVSKGIGATIISAAGGMEFALESPDWNNGVFTYSLLNGIKSGEADLNKDGNIKISELKEYVTYMVTKLTEGRQVPNARKVNLNNDFIIK